MTFRKTEIEAVVYKKQMKHNDNGQHGQTGGHMYGRQAELMNGWDGWRRAGWVGESRVI